MGSFRLSPAAQRDLDGIFDYTAEHWGVAQAIRYTTDIKDACASLADSPAQGRDCGHIRAGYRSRAVGRHTLYFKASPYGVAVIRILHERMDVGRRL